MVLKVHTVFECRLIYLAETRVQGHVTLVMRQISSQNGILIAKREGKRSLEIWKQMGG